jgi:hypothetical protein
MGWYIKAPWWGFYIVIFIVQKLESCQCLVQKVDIWIAFKNLALVFIVKKCYICQII